MKSNRMMPLLILLAGVSLTGCYRWEYVEMRPQPAAEISSDAALGTNGSSPVAGAPGTHAVGDSVPLLPVVAPPMPVNETWRVKVRRVDSQRTAGLIALSTASAMLLAKLIFEDGGTTSSRSTSSSGSGPFGCWFSC